jgi:hypothetical protein
MVHPIFLTTLHILLTPCIQCRLPLINHNPNTSPFRRCNPNVTQFQFPCPILSTQPSSYTNRGQQTTHLWLNSPEKQNSSNATTPTRPQRNTTPSSRRPKEPTTSPTPSPFPWAGQPASSTTIYKPCGCKDCILPPSTKEVQHPHQPGIAV